MNRRPWGRTGARSSTVRRRPGPLAPAADRSAFRQEVPMLAPGDCLMAPVHAELIPPAQTKHGEAPTPTVTPTSVPSAKAKEKKDEGEPRSFLLRLLRCLGAIHT